MVDKKHSLTCVDICLLDSYCFAWILIILFINSAGGCSKSAAINQKSSPVLSESIGPLFPDALGVDIKHDFTVQNPSSSEAMHLRIAGRSCGCVSASIDPDVIAPGGSAKVSFSFHLPRETRTISQSVSIVSDLPNAEKFDLLLSVSEYARIAIDAPFATTSIKPGESKDIPFLVRVCVPPNEELPKMVDVSSSEDIVRVTKREPIQVPNQDALILEVPCVANIRHPGTDDFSGVPRNWNCEIRAGYGLEHESKTLCVVEELPLTAEPGKVFFCGSVNMRRMVRIRSDGKPFSMVACESSSNSLTAKIDADRKALEHDVEIQVKQLPSKEKYFTAYIDVITDLIDQPKVRIPVNVLQLQ